MADPLDAWIASQRQAGKKDEEIFSLLMQHGYTPTRAKRALKGDTTPSRLPIPLWLIALGLLFVGVIISGIVLLLRSGPSEAPTDLTELSQSAQERAAQAQQRQQALHERTTPLPTPEPPSPPPSAPLEQTPPATTTPVAGNDRLVNTTDGAETTNLTTANQSSTSEVENSSAERFSPMDNDTTEESANTTTAPTQNNTDQSAPTPQVNESTTTASTTQTNTTNQTPESSAPSEPSVPTGATVIKQGYFLPQQYPGTGQAVLYQNEGNYTLLLQDFATGEGPDLHVFLSDDLTIDNAVDVGPLPSIRGSFVFPINQSVTSHSQVLVWCGPFEVLFTSATLE